MKLIKKFEVVLAASIIFVASCLPALSQNGARSGNLGFCSLSSVSSATAITTTSCTLASFTATGSGTQLTVSSVTGLISPGDPIAGSGVPTGTVITAQVSVSPPGASPGGSGIYTTNNATTSSAASLTAGGVPQAATYAVICASTQGVNYRDDGVAPTATVGTGGQGIVPTSSTSPPTCIPYNGTFSLLQFIQQNAGAIVGITWYK